MKVAVFTALLACIAHCNGERVLFMAPASSKSHKFSFMPIAEALAAKGHQVTVVTPHKPTKTIENLSEIVIRDIAKDMSINLFDMQKENPLVAAIKMFSMFGGFIQMSYSSLMASEEFQEIIKNPNFDLVVVNGLFNEFVLPIVDEWNVPRIAYLPASGVTWILIPFGISAEYATIPAGMADYDDQMTFFQRLKNMLSTEVFLLMRKYFILPTVDEMVKKDFPNARPALEIEGENSLVFVNHHLATAWPRPLPPHVIPLGGIHLRPGKPLPENLQTFADGATDGLIVFTLGSAIPVSSMPPEAAQTFIQVFSKLPQRVVWKWEKDGMDNIPPNVLLIDWLPQQDLLEHPNTRLFISHGGLGGTQESLYSSVPMLGLPFSNDQQTNVIKAQKDGWATLLNWNQVTEKTLTDSITALLEEPRFRANATKLSKLLRDEMVPAKDVAVYWVEHVLRHGGAKHLQLSSKNMPLYQYFLIDVWLFLVGIAALLALISTLSIRYLCKRACKAAKLKTN